MSDQIDKLESNETTIQKAQTVANLIGKFLHSIRLQLEYAKIKGQAASSVIPALETGKTART